MCPPAPFESNHELDCPTSQIPSDSPLRNPLVWPLIMLHQNPHILWAQTVPKALLQISPTWQCALLPCELDATIATIGWLLLPNGMRPMILFDCPQSLDIQKIGPPNWTIRLDHPQNIVESLTWPFFMRRRGVHTHYQFSSFPHQCHPDMCVRSHPGRCCGNLKTPWKRSWPLKVCWWFPPGCAIYWSCNLPVAACHLGLHQVLSPKAQFVLCLLPLRRLWYQLIRSQSRVIHNCKNARILLGWEFTTILFG